MEENWEMWQPLLSCLELHKGYCSNVLEMLNSMFYGDGPLPMAHRQYIALMAACRHHCEFLITLHKAEFLRVGGDPEWLKGLPRALEKIQHLDEINRVLAHRPWLTEVAHIRELCRVGNSKNWSLNELVYAVLILSRVHSLCSFIHGCGVHSDFEIVAAMNGEAEQPSTLPRCNSLDSRRLSKGHMGAKKRKGSDKDRSGHVPELLAQLQELNLAKSEVNGTTEEKIRAFNSVHEQSLPLENARMNGGPECDLGCGAFTGALSYRYEDFFNRANHASSPTLKIHDFSWENQGFGVFGQLMNSTELIDLIDHGFSIVQALTYKTMGNHANVDTTKYRVAVWNYILSLFGIRYDDYNYAEVNKLLDRRMKTFIKTAACLPERVTVNLRESVMVDFSFSEKVHVNMLISEARFQASLNYFSRAVMQYMT
uniref:Sestrin n=1 Tax=Trichuris muris TaxID=70415 RepID=A0A5S6QF33_TRIMR